MRYLIKRRRLNSHLMIWRWAELINYYLLRFHGQNVKMPNLEPFEEEVTLTGAIRQRNQGGRMSATSIIALIHGLLATAAPLPPTDDAAICRWLCASSPGRLLIHIYILNLEAARMRLRLRRQRITLLPILPVIIVVRRHCRRKRSERSAFDFGFDSLARVAFRLSSSVYDPVC